LATWNRSCIISACGAFSSAAAMKTGHISMSTT
jgi:hypothetical protein